MQEAVSVIHHLRRRQDRRRLRGLILGFGLILALFAIALCVGQNVTPPGEVLRVLSGETIKGVSFTIHDLRLPRALLAIVAGASFGMGGVTFQTILRNPLASPDIIGISAGASAAAVFTVVILGLSGFWVSLSAFGSALAVVFLIYGMSWHQGIANARLILMGIGVSAMLNSVTAYVLSQASSWSLTEAMRWLIGSLNGAQLGQSVVVGGSLLVFGAILQSKSRMIESLRMGDETSAALGVAVESGRMLAIIAAVGLIAVATAVVGPISFVAFIAGPIAARLFGGARSLLLPAALVGAIIVLSCDFIGQFLLPNRLPVGVVTGAIGAPYLLFLIITSHRQGGQI